MSVNAPMRLCVTGRDGLLALMISASSRLNETCTSEENLKKSSRSPGFCPAVPLRSAVSRGSEISEKSLYVWLQNAVPHASLRRPISSNRRDSHDWNASSQWVQWHLAVPWHPSSLSVCHATTPGWCPKCLVTT